MRIGLAGPITTSSFSQFLRKKDLDSAPKGHGGTPVNQLAIGLLERGFHVTLFSLDESVSDRQVLEGHQLKIIFGPYRHAKRARDFYRKEHSFIGEAINAERIDLINAHWTYEYAVGALSSGKPNLITVHDWAPAILRNNPHPGVLMRSLMSAYVFVRGKYFTANSPYIANKIQRIPGKFSTMIPNAIADELFRAVERSPSSMPLNIISINNGFSFLKNVQKLLKAFPLMLHSEPNLRLQLVGSGFEPGGVAERWAKSHDLTQNVDFLGPQPYETIYQLLSEAALLIHPSREESFGLTLLEAMAQQTPVIGGKHSGAVPWVLEGGKAGILVNIDQPAAIAEAAISILRDHERWRSLSDSGFQYAYDNFRLTKVVDQYLAVYQDVLDGKWQVT